MFDRGGGPSFVAIDFETADPGRDSARGAGGGGGGRAGWRGRVPGSAPRNPPLTGPPRREFVFTYIHGIAWEHVEDASPFAEVWEELRPLFEGADFLAAHNAPFDKSVLQACCRSARLDPPPLPFECTVRHARRGGGGRATARADGWPRA